MDPEKVEKGGQVQRAQSQQDEFKKPEEPHGDGQPQVAPPEKAEKPRDAA